MRFCYIRKYHLSEERRARCTLPYCHRDSRCGASSLAESSAPGPLGRLAEPAYSAVTSPAALAVCDCRLAVVLAFDGLRCCLGLAARAPSLGSSLWFTCGPHSAAPAKLVGFAAEGTVFLRLVPHALELCEPGRNSEAAARLARVGGNRTALAACLGLALETHQAA